MNWHVLHEKEGLISTSDITYGCMSGLLSFSTWIKRRTGTGKFWAVYDVSDYFGPTHKTVHLKVLEHVRKGPLNKLFKEGEDYVHDGTSLKISLDMPYRKTMLLKFILCNLPWNFRQWRATSTSFSKLSKNSVSEVDAWFMYASTQFSITENTDRAFSLKSYSDDSWVSLNMFDFRFAYDLITCPASFIERINSNQTSIISYVVDEVNWKYTDARLNNLYNDLLSNRNAGAAYIGPFVFRTAAERNSFGTSYGIVYSSSRTAVSTSVQKKVNEGIYKWLAIVSAKHTKKPTYWFNLLVAKKAGALPLPNSYFGDEAK